MKLAIRNLSFVFQKVAIEIKFVVSPTWAGGQQCSLAWAQGAGSRAGKGVGLTTEALGCPWAWREDLKWATPRGYPAKVSE